MSLCAACACASRCVSKCQGGQKCVCRRMCNRLTWSMSHGHLTQAQIVSYHSLRPVPSLSGLVGPHSAAQARHGPPAPMVADGRLPGAAARSAGVRGPGQEMLQRAAPPQSARGHMGAAGDLRGARMLLPPVPASLCLALCRDFFAETGRLARACLPRGVPADIKPPGTRHLRCVLAPAPPIASGAFQGRAHQRKEG